MKYGLILNLQLFGEAVAGGEAASAEEASSQGNASSHENTASQEDAAFDALINGQYKDAYGRKVQALQAQLEQEKQARLWDRRNYEAQELQRQYPQFSLEEEMKVQRFRELLEGGLSLRTAYELCHGEELLAGLRYRPRENGMGEQTAAAVLSDVSALSRSQRREIIRRVQRGETIRF